ncbi:MAG: hypothetical protein L0Y58_22160, partial [Verrucomicrobia subdivision 3 bacterium]|nr:hypothetical protein [Limisphaerales bacterium]
MNLILSVNTDQAQIAQAPGFTRMQWPDMSNQQWLQQSFSFFGVQADGAIGATGTTGFGGVTVTGAATNTIGTTATGGTNQSRLGATGVAVPTNATSTTLPPTGRPVPGRPDLNRPQVPDIPP